MLNELICTIPELKPKEFYNNLDWRARQKHTSTTSWPILALEVATVLALFIGKRRTLDAGAGTGFISRHLQNLGAKNIIASDVGGEEFSKYDMSALYKRDHVGNSLDLLPGNFEIILLSWPPYLEPFAFEVAKKMALGTILIYNGEGWGGCTGDDQFHEYLEDRFTVMENITEQLGVHHARFSGIYDRWTVYRKVIDELAN